MTDPTLSNPPVDVRAVLSATWVAILLANLFRDVHEILRPGFVDELAHDGTVYGATVSDATLLASGVVLVGLCSTVVLARVLRRRWNRRVNVVAAIALSGGVLATWPKDPDDLLFGAALLAGAAFVIATCLRWRDTAQHSSPSTSMPMEMDGPGLERASSTARRA